MTAPLLKVDNLCISAPSGPIVQGVGFTLERGRTLALIGESGSGKSMTALSILGLLPPGLSHATEGGVIFAGEALPLGEERRMRTIRGKRIAMVFQDPMACLNPFSSVGSQLDETLRRLNVTAREVRRERSQRLLTEVGLPDPPTILRRYPHELSGGQQQRVMIAMAIAGEPELLVADEPTSALDASVADGIVRLLADLQRRHRMAMLFITHDLAIAARLAHDIAVMQRGKVVEIGAAQVLMSAPRHPCSTRLIGARRMLGAPRSPAPTTIESRVLVANGVSVDYAPRRLFGRPFRAVEDVSLTLGAGNTLGILGESGSGKSTLGAAIAGLIGISGGCMTVLGQERTQRLHTLQGSRRRECQLIFQNPYGALNPRLTIAQLMAEPLALMGVAAAQHTERTTVALAEVGLERQHMMRYPHQLSGGQRQRVSISRALLCRPRLLVCDEVVSALDTTVKVQILKLLKRLQEAYGFGMVFIGHDIEVVRWISDEIIVMHKGRITDRFAAAEMEADERDTWTKRLLACTRVPSHSPSTAHACG
ncbi:dipeptide ABC transporter ATP-binding protein [Billgrantia endophytica]|uniref:Microcin ABC transporter ATP-binding protein n=1 Tax=Billgrantia endophytica TaxID=2033802 RepID=A0A2N7UAC1_9GAMM|nr:ABC transporter ATP-binding protein [Halomonas endophytica]PMR77394.1 microcin ABC transporter ATP-binding protein [Halomonas endophytica]